MNRSFAVLVLIILGGVFAVRAATQAEPPRTASGSRSPSANNVSSDGTFQPANSRQSVGHVVLQGCQIKLFYDVQLAAEKAGVLDMVVPEGQWVKQGEMLAHTRDDVVKASLAVANKQAANDVEIRYAKKAGELAQVEYERDLQANSVVPGTVSDLTLRAHRLAAEKALLQLEQAEIALEIENLKRNETLEQLRNHKVISPIDAQVRTVFKKQGEAVAEGEPILELVNTSRVKVEGYVHLKDLDSIKVGSLVRVQLDVPDADLPSERLTFPGRIAYIDVKVEPVSHSVKVWAEVSNQGGILKDGLTARMAIDRHQVAPNFAATRPSSKN